MLTPDRLKPFLLHDDPDVRSFVVDYFSQSWSDDPELLPLVLDSCERFGLAEDGKNLYGAASFAVTGPTLDRLLGLLDRAEDPETIRRLNRVVVNAPGAVLRGRREAIDGSANILPEFRPRLQARQDYVDWPGERLWAELQAFAERSADQMYADEINQGYADDLIDALGDHDVPDAATICRAVEAIEEDDEDGGWLECFLIDLAGRRRIREAIPALLATFHFEGLDYDTDRATLALERIGDPEAVRLIHGAYPGASDDYRLSAAFLLGRIKHPESESVALELLEDETDEMLRTWLCVSLCDLFSERGFDAVRREMVRGSVGTFRELCSPALVLIKVLGLDPPPEAELWEQERLRQRESMKRAMADMESLGLAGDGDEDDLMDDLYDDPGPEEYPGPVTAPIRNVAPKVGRNDPCPCGSGKKFKKCCGRSA